MNNLAYFHPVAGGAVLAFLFYVGSLALRSRSRRRGAAALLAQHARLAPWMFVLVLVGWAGGLFSTWWLRHDLELGGSTHLRIGVGLVVALTGGCLTSRVMRKDRKSVV